MNKILGKSMMLWQIKGVEGGNPQYIAESANYMGCNSLQVKAANGVSSYNLQLTVTGYKDTLIGPLADALSQLGIELWGWHYIYGNEPEREAQKAVERMGAYPFKGWIIDVEKEFKVSDAASRARRFMSTFRGLAPDVTLAFCSYRYPSLHREVPYHEFLPGCDFVMPQVYWVQADNPAGQLRRTVDEYKALCDKIGIDSLPMIPVGAAFKESGWAATGNQVEEFLDAAKNVEKLEGVSFWRHGHAISLGLDDTIATFDWPVEDTTPPLPPDQSLEERLEAVEAKAAANAGTLVVHDSRLSQLEQRASMLEAEVKDVNEALEDHVNSAPTNPPAGKKLVTVHGGDDKKAPAFAAVGENAKGYPIIELNAYEKTGDSALLFVAYETVLVYDELIRSDGAKYWYRLADVPLHGYEALYINQDEVTG